MSSLGNNAKDRPLLKRALNRGTLTLNPDTTDFITDEHFKTGDPVFIIKNKIVHKKTLVDLYDKFVKNNPNTQKPFRINVNKKPPIEIGIHDDIDHYIVKIINGPPEPSWGSNNSKLRPLLEVAYYNGILELNSKTTDSVTKKPFYDDEEVFVINERIIVDKKALENIYDIYVKNSKNKKPFQISNPLNGKMIGINDIKRYKVKLLNSTVPYESIHTKLGVLPELASHFTGEGGRRKSKRLRKNRRKTTKRR